MSKPCLPLERKRKISETEVICFDDIENLDAATYLSRVAAEASRLPEILQSADSAVTTVVATTTATVAAAAAVERTREPPQRPIVTTGSAASALYLVSHRTALYPPPSVDHLPKAPLPWRDTALTNFVKLRSFLHEACVKPTVRLPVPPMKDRGGWHVFCVGNDAAYGNPGGYFADNNNNNDDDDSSEEEEEDDEKGDSDEDMSATAAAAAAVVVPEWRRSLPTDGYRPTVPLLLQMDQVMIRAVLHHLAFFVTAGFRLHNNLAGWIYALLARLEQPIHRDEAVMLYALLKRLTIVRKSTLPATTHKGDSSSSSSVDELAACNLLILILVAYFEQGDSSALEVVEQR